jgi:hypothetical protein
VKGELEERGRDMERTREVERERELYCRCGKNDIELDYNALS